MLKGDDVYVGCRGGTPISGEKGGKAEQGGAMGPSISLDCRKVADANPNTAVAFSAYLADGTQPWVAAKGSIVNKLAAKQERPALVFSFKNREVSIKRVNVFNHRLEHPHRHIRSFEVHCSCLEAEKKDYTDHLVQSFPDLHSTPEWENADKTGNWASLKVTGKCPCHKTKRWWVKEMKGMLIHGPLLMLLTILTAGCGDYFHVHDLQLSPYDMSPPIEDQKETIQGWCAAHEVDITVFRALVD